MKYFLSLQLIYWLLNATMVNAVDKSTVIDITRYGAVGDGKTLNTTAIQKAIDACSAKGGGQVRVPSGTWLTGTLLLKNKVILQVDENATLLGSPDIKDYQVVDGFKDGLGQQMGYALIGAIEATNTGITGKGTIDGQGKLVRASGGHERRPFLVRFVRCHQIKVADIHLQGPTAWTMHFFHCTNILTEKVTIRSRGLGNNDGIDIDCCEKVVIRDCDIDSGDDAICFKTTSPYPCRDVTVSNIKINTGEGAIKFGTESAGNFENIQVSHIDVAFAREGGIKLFSVDGSHLRNIRISDVKMDKVNMPIIIRLGSRLKTFREGDAKQTVGSISDISIKDVSVQHGTWTGMLISGIPGHYIDGISLENIRMNIPGEGTAADAQVKLEERENDYPEIKMFGKQIPAYALYIRHAKNIRFHNVTYTCDQLDARPAVIANDIADVQLSQWTLPGNTGKEPLVRIADSKKVELKAIRHPASPVRFLQLEGNAQQVTVDGAVAAAPPVAPLWKEFVDARKNNTIPALPDFSYAGYHFSEKPLPELSGRKKFDVTQYGAIPNDEQYDDEAIQRAVEAAAANPGGGIVFFPKGKYLLAPDEDNKKQILITSSNIILQGSGSQEGGTEIYQDKKRLNDRQFLFRPAQNNPQRLTTITANAPRETFTVQVADAARLQPGQDVVIRHRSEAYTKWYFDPLPLKQQWTRLFGDNGGMQVQEIHTIEKINGNTVTFKNPLHLDIHLIEGKPFELMTYNSLEECGITGIRFSSNWKSYPEDFVHHKNEIHDYAWEAVGMEYVKNSWIRDCVFQDWNEGVNIRAGYQVTVQNVTFLGKKGHASVHARTGYGVLIKQCYFNGAQHHGPGTGYSAAGTVITQCALGTDQNFDSHSGQPYATLFDDIRGGVFYNLGGPEPGHPHHGKQLVLWNFKHSSAKDQHYNFWDTERRRNYTIAAPILAGFQADSKVTVENAGINELPGQAVAPASLFEAQLALRLYGKDITR
ncbi:DUF4955 domain-containing protein [Chitinophaga qingshengii]|uniref:DUF4955 domain-containing protein n=1 Tax=Chitinophaga qingshengii TaxID=1569794 RepID=A0ABR7TLU4_9BACT|nr:DUF4955 domain-containing protein [Chitinophaga qingshengii]MBC9930945.1 DUF4955 domain-containing protein [Chitinophaga qingshengii]